MKDFDINLANYTSVMGPDLTKGLRAKFNWQTKREDLEKYILEEVRLQIKKKLSTLDILISSQLKLLLQLAIQSSELYQALVNRQESIYFELGAVNSPETMHELVEVVKNTVIVAPLNPRKLGNRINISIVCSAINNNFSEALSLTSGKYISTNKHGHSTTINWLEWLLKSPPHIQGWDVIFKPSPSSRTGYAIMAEMTNRAWELPIEFAGTLEDNFVTRAIEEYDVRGRLNSYVQSTVELLLK